MAWAAAFGARALGWFEQQVQGTGGFTDGGQRDGGVAGGGVDAGMTEQRLDDAGVDAGLQQVSGKGVAEAVGGNVFGEAAAPPGFAAGGLHGAGGQMQMRTPRGKQPGGAGAQDAKVGAKDFQQTGGEHGVAVFAALAMLDADEFAGTVDIGDFEGDGLGDAEPGSVAGQQDGAVLDAGDMV